MTAVTDDQPGGAAPARGRWAASPALVRRLALASLTANVAIVVSGGAVRLTDSGLGCPTVPACTADSLVPTAELGVHGAIEFGNRMFTFVVGALALAAFLAAWHRRPRHRGLVRPAALVLVGIPAQAVVGAVTVLTDLNPWVVGCHFLVSMGVIAAGYALWRRAGAPAGAAAGAGARLRGLAWVLVAAAAAVLALGTVVTGSGPHAGDAAARRTGLDLETVAQLHTDAVFLLLGLTVAAWFAARAVAAPAAGRAAGILLAVVLGQGLIGAVQYLTDLPKLLVGAHLLGASLVWVATLGLLHATGVRAAPPAGHDARPARAATTEPALTAQP
jgi:cytochrome c oxidase assembly protein subunit 15